MKRLLVVILSLVYLAASSGFTLRQHYCMGQLVGTAIDHPADNGDGHRCGRCGMVKRIDSKGCCKDKVKTFRANPDQLPVKALQAQATMFAAILPASFALPCRARVASLPEVACTPAHGPPGRTSLPLYLQVCCLRL